MKEIFTYLVMAVIASLFLYFVYIVGSGWNESGDMMNYDPTGTIYEPR